MKERDFCKSRITPWLKENNIYYFKPRGGPYSTRKGVPDYILCIGGLFIGLEVKTEKGRLTAWQEEESEKIDAAGGTHLTVRPSNWEAIKSVIKGLPNSLGEI